MIILRFLGLYAIICVLFFAPNQTHAALCDAYIKIETNQFIPCSAVAIRTARDWVYDWANVLTPLSKDDIVRTLQQSDMPAAYTAVLTMSDYVLYQPQRPSRGNIKSLDDFASILFVNLDYANHSDALLIILDQASSRVIVRGDAQYLKRYRVEIEEIKTQLLEANENSKTIQPQLTEIPKIIVRSDGMIQDMAQLFGPNDKSAYERSVAVSSINPNQLTLVTLKDFRNYRTNPNSPAQNLNAFVDQMLEDWGLARTDKSILIVHQTKDDTVLLRFGNGYSPDERLLINNAFQKYYVSKFKTIGSAGSHIRGAGGFFAALPQGIFRLKSIETAPIQIQKITKRGKLLRDYADVIAPSIEKRLTEMMGAPFLRAPITLITLTDYELYTSETMRYRPPKSFKQFADKIAGDLGIFGSEFQLVILHDLKRNRIEIRGGYRYSVYDIRNIRNRYAGFFGYLLAQTAHLQALEDLVKSMPGGADYVALKEPLEQRNQTEDNSKPGINFVIGAISLSIISFAVIHMIRSALINRPRPESKQRKSRISAWKKARRGRIGKSIFVPKPVEKDGKITCPRCGGPVKITKKAARGYFANAHSHRSCTRCSWFSITVPRQKKS